MDEEEGKTENNYNGLAVLSVPITIGKKKIYGVLYNSKTDSETLSQYIDFLAGTEIFIWNGGTVSDDARVWNLPDDVHSFLANQSLIRIVSHLMKGVVQFKKIELDEPIEWKDNEVDFEENRLVISRDLIDRYENKEMGNEETEKYDE